MVEQKQSFAEKYKSQASAGDQTGSMTDRYKKKESSMTASAMSKKTPTAADTKTSSKADLVYLVKGIDDSKNAWYYVLVERLKLSLFLKALNDDIIHLENYGKILYSAYGEEPPKDITEKLKTEFGVED